MGKPRGATWQRNAIHPLLSGMDQNGWGLAWFALAVVTAGLAEQKHPQHRPDAR